jgi:hypothetical protein
MSYAKLGAITPVVSNPLAPLAAQQTTSEGVKIVSTAEAMLQPVVAQATQQILGIRSAAAQNTAAATAQQQQIAAQAAAQREATMANLGTYAVYGIGGIVLVYLISLLFKGR